MSLRLLLPCVLVALAVRPTIGGDPAIVDTGDAQVPTPVQLRGAGSGVPMPQLLRMKSSVLFPLTIATSCAHNQTLLPGEEVQIVVSKAKTFWVIPQGMAWDCQGICSDCFYVAANLTADSMLEARVGYGAATESIANAVEVNGLADIKNVPGIAAGGNNAVVAGVELVPIGRFDGAKDAASCTQIFCDFGRLVTAGKRGLTLEIHGAELLEELAPLWRGGDSPSRSWGYYHSTGLARHETRRYRRCWWLSDAQFSCAWIER